MEEKYWENKESYIDDHILAILISNRDRFEQLKDIKNLKEGWEFTAFWKGFHVCKKEMETVTVTTNTVKE